jgi:hypothetical protein
MGIVVCIDRDWIGDDGGDFVRLCVFAGTTSTSDETRHADMLTIQRLVHVAFILPLHGQQTSPNILILSIIPPPNAVDALPPLTIVTTRPRNKILEKID